MKIQCPCGAKYAFDVTPEMVREPVKFICPQCGRDSSEVVNEMIRAEFAEQNLPPAPPTPAAPVAEPKAAPARLKISHADKSAEAPASEAASPAGHTSKYCSRHTRILATEKCSVCGKPICPQCLEVFGYFCSPLCKNKADQRGLVTPEYGGKRAAEKKMWRNTSLIFGSVFALVVLTVTFGLWYALFGSHPRPFFSVRFADDDRAYAGSVQVVAPDQVVFLHGGTLARYNLKTGQKVWSHELISSNQIAALVNEVVDARSRANQNVTDGNYIHVPPPGTDERDAKASLQDQLTLRVSGQDIWVASPGRLTHYDWNTGEIVKVTSIPNSDTGLPNESAGGGLFSTDGKPLDPNKVQAQAQNLNLPARIALPALLANSSHEAQLEAALRDADGASHAPRQNNASAPAQLENVSVVGNEYGLAQFSVVMLQKNEVSREAMRARPRKSALDNPDLNVNQTADVANETLNEMQRNNGGDTVNEDDSRYQVTVHIPDATDISNWTGEVVGPPSLYVLKSVNVIAAGKTVIVLDKTNKKLWEASLTYNVPPGNDSDTSDFGAGPCVEHNGVLFVFDQAVLSAFDLTTGNARWRLPTVGVVGLFFDDHGDLYVNTTTGNPDDIKYSRQIDITKSTAAVLLKIEPASGKILWRASPGGFISYLSGDYMYSVQSYDPNPTDDVPLNDAMVDLQKPPYLRIVRINPKNGRLMWDYEQDRCPVYVQFDQNVIELVFKREVQVLKYLVL